MAAEKKGMTGPLVVGAVVFLLLWFVFGMSFFGSLVAAAAAGAIGHFAFGNKPDGDGDTVSSAVATATPAPQKEDPAPAAEPEPAPEPAPVAEAAPEPEATVEPAPAPTSEAETPAAEVSSGSTLLAGEEELASRKGTWKYDASGS